ncbi:hypothetical protein SERLA73DRAFT_80980 [Serpula lacrymans var. lacrymans S7.3]|uniref:Integrase catalytic domain-containing protein n=1 Tax=Serpula lacrymans var. lacrymans (strain S7.3) TaxID=936435 RepID=F8QKK0_SERL3|nr:hypothetical protein SERLA73DRAFT_80980 [Serpula lacrymans var. lacrymans S7.3]
MKKLPFKSTGGNRAKRPIQIVHTDVGGPIKPTSREGFRYWIIIQWKEDVQTFFRTHLGEENFTPLYTEFLRSNGGGEYTGNAFKNQL